MSLTLIQSKMTGEEWTTVVQGTTILETPLETIKQLFPLSQTCPTPHFDLHLITREKNVNKRISEAVSSYFPTQREAMLQSLLCSYSGSLVLKNHDSIIEMFKRVAYEMPTLLSAIESKSFPLSNTQQYQELLNELKEKPIPSDDLLLFAFAAFLQGDLTRYELANFSLFHEAKRNHSLRKLSNDEKGVWINNLLNDGRWSITPTLQEIADYLCTQPLYVCAPRSNVYLCEPVLSTKSDTGEQLLHPPHVFQKILDIGFKPHATKLNPVFGFSTAQDFETAQHRDSYIPCGWFSFPTKAHCTSTPQLGLYLHDCIHLLNESTNPFRQALVELALALKESSPLDYNTLLDKNQRYLPCDILEDVNSTFFSYLHPLIRKDLALKYIDEHKEGWKVKYNIEFQW